MTDKKNQTCFEQLVHQDDIFLFHQGTNYHSYQLLGAHVVHDEDNRNVKGARFGVWAPNAEAVHVIGDFNNWQGDKDPLRLYPQSRIWGGFIPEAQEGDSYKYLIKTRHGHYVQKADPFAFFAEKRPKSASRIFDLQRYTWQDQEWTEKMKHVSPYEEPMSIYEVHLGSWVRTLEGEPLNYKELAEKLAPYVSEMGYTHVELLPVMEHPHDGSWGYQITGYYAPTSRYGTPEDFMYLVDRLHQYEIGVILDWVPGHFARDGHGLIDFDGEPVFESQDIKRCENPEWGTRNFDYGRPEVQSFLVSNCLYWMDKFHVDGFRIDAVASMLYLDYGQNRANPPRNQYGGRENLEALAFIRKMNEAVFRFYPKALMIAEESTAWPLVSKPTYLGGLGFNFKWNMGWMNDMLTYMQIDPFFRKWHHNLVTFSFMYAFSENFVLPISHDEVVHGKRSLLDKMPGDEWQKFANLRLFIGYKTAHPGKKLLFMGCEFAQYIEWDHAKSLDWHLLNHEKHRQMQDYIKELNAFYRQHPSLWEYDFDWHGFEWIDPNNAEQSIITFIRRGKSPTEYLIIICNFTPECYGNYRVGVPESGRYLEIFNSDDKNFGGSGQKNFSPLEAEEEKWQTQPYSINLIIPPLATVFLQKQ